MLRNKPQTTSCNVDYRRYQKGRSKYGSTKAYRAWVSMKARCLNPNANTYSNYGGRGVKICERWIDSFDTFFEDMGHPPSTKHSLDKDIKGGVGCLLYSKETCCWALPKDQCRHTRKNVFITDNGETLCISEWAERAGVSRNTAWLRYKNGDPIVTRIPPNEIKVGPPYFNKSLRLYTVTFKINGKRSTRSASTLEDAKTIRSRLLAGEIPPKKPRGIRK